MVGKDICVRHFNAVEDKNVIWWGDALETGDFVDLVNFVGRKTIERRDAISIVSDFQKCVDVIFINLPAMLVTITTN
jgi:hypothetical protein